MFSKNFFETENILIKFPITSLLSQNSQKIGKSQKIFNESLQEINRYGAQYAVLNETSPKKFQFNEDISSAAISQNFLKVPEFFTLEEIF